MDAATANSIRRKIAALERMTIANGCTPAEAANAMLMAARLRAKLPPLNSYAESVDNKEREEIRLNREAIHKYWMNEYFREFRQPLREKRQSNTLNELDEFLKKAGAFGRFRF